MSLQDFMDMYAEPDHTLKADGFDDAILGIDSKQRVVYSIGKILKKLQSQDMTTEEAIEYFYYNIEGANMGEHTPVYMFVYEEEKDAKQK
jgi:hypothetical protein|tara:strand:+ start:2172 stop:2441 length:270 start_codon:yes stop_codon:yes gene_type:complete